MRAVFIEEGTGKEIVNTKYLEHYPAVYRIPAPFDPLDFNTLLEEISDNPKPTKMYTCTRMDIEKEGHIFYSCKIE